MNINNLNNSAKKEASIDNYIIKEDIGEGNFGKLKLGKHKSTGELYAIKILNKKTIKEKMKNTIFRENEIISKFHHINIVNVFELIEDKENYYIIMEYCQKGELFDYIVDKEKLSENEASMFFYQLINGVSYIHKMGIAHRDLKPENLLLTKDKILKIIDFGLSHEFDGFILLKTKCGSPSYAAPELIKGKKYDGFEIDVWCCGIILYAMVCGYLPFDGENNKELFKKIVECKTDYPVFMSKNCRKLLESILVPDPNKRITIEDIKKSEFYLKGKELCKIKYKINLEELDQESIDNIKNEENIKRDSENNNEMNKNNIEISDKNENDSKDNDFNNDRLFTKIEVTNQTRNKNIDNNINDNENYSLNNEKRGKINEKERKKYEILFGTIRNDEIISKNTNINTHSNPKNRINNITNTFRQKIINNKINNNISTIKQTNLNNESYRFNNILQTETINQPNIELNNSSKLNLKTINRNNNSTNNSLNIDFHSRYNNHFNMINKKYKFLETRSNEYAKIINKFPKKKNYSPNYSLLNSKENLKFNKKLILDNNNCDSNHISQMNSVKEKLNYLTTMNDIKNLELENINTKNSTSNKNFNKIPPLKDGGNILINANLFYNDINININNLNLNNINDKINNSNKVRETNFLPNSEKLKININNYSSNKENISDFLKYKNNIFKNGNNNSLNTQRIKDNAISENIYNTSQRNYSYKSRINPSKLISDFENQKILKNSIEINNINNNRGYLKKKIFKNYYNINGTNSLNIHLNENNRNKTLNNGVSINNWHNKMLSMEKTPQHTKIKIKEDKTDNYFKKNSYDNAIGNKSENHTNINNILRTNYNFDSNDGIKFRKGHKNQIAFKEFLNILKSNNTIKLNNNENNNNNGINNNSQNKDILPYL